MPERDSPGLVSIRRLIGGLTFAVLSAGMLPGCGDDEPRPLGGCPDGECTCAGNSCICPAAGDCFINCTSACDLQCAGSGACDFTCGDGCNVSCTGSGNCVSSVGIGSFIDCPSNSNCQATCAGDCRMSCTGSGDCDLICPQGLAPQSCGGDIIACGACP